MTSTCLAVDTDEVGSSQAKIALKAASEEQLDELEAIAKSLNLCARAIHDAYVTRGRISYQETDMLYSGRTQIAAGSKTVLAIGPGTWLVEFHAVNRLN